VRSARTETLVVCVIALVTFCCTWVPLTEAGEHVRLVRADAVAGCQKIGNVSAKTADRVTIFARSDRKVQTELESLARNEASELGGDAVAPIGTPTDGRQSFDVYRCQPR
jgi:hypothetical protein